MSIKYSDELNQMLFQFLPELRPIAENKLAYWGDEEPNSHVVYGDILASYLKSTDPEDDHEILQRSFELLENLSHRPKRSSANSVLMTEVLHTIMSSVEDEDRSDVLEWLKKVRIHYMGEETCRLAKIRASVFEDEYRQKCLIALGADLSSDGPTSQHE